MEKQDSLIHQNNRRAGFVTIENNDTETFKYNFPLIHSKYINKKLTTLRDTSKKIKQIIQLKLDKFDFIAARSAVSVWLINSFIEGLIVNFSVWGLLGWRFNLITIMAWGFAITQSLNIYWRLKINGSNTKFPEKN